MCGPISIRKVPPDQNGKIHIQVAITNLILETTTEVVHWSSLRSSLRSSPKIIFIVKRACLEPMNRRVSEKPIHTVINSMQYHGRAKHF